MKDTVKDTAARLAARVRAAGVVGAGGAGFPTHVKIQTTTPVLVINGAECEPLLRVDQQLLLHRTEDVLAGVRALRDVLQPSTCIVAVKAKHEAVLAAWGRYAGDGLAVHPLGDFYPAGDEHLLVHEVTGRVVPAGGLPLEVGVTVLNVETVYNVGKAIRGLPVTHKFVTVGGAVARPATLLVPVGTPFADLVAAVGGPRGEVLWVEGGPMMGRLVEDLAESVTRTTKGFLALPADLPFFARQRAGWRTVKRLSASTCELCQQCTDMCPRYLLGHDLEPHRLMRYYAFGQGDVPADRAASAALLCVECGVCEAYACPAGVFPRRVTAAVKRGLQEHGQRAGRDGKSPAAPRPWYRQRRVPTARLVARLGLSPWDDPAPLAREELAVTRVRVPLTLPFGGGCRPLVGPGTRVERGDLLAEPAAGTAGVPVHASIGGMVMSVTDTYVEVVAEARGGGASGHGD